MIVKHARDAARQWVEQEASRMVGFHGAFLAGSINWMPDHAPMPASSDVDVKVVLDTPSVPGDMRKFPYRGVVLEVSYAPRDDVRTAEAILVNYHTAGHFTRPNVLLDPSGQLTAIQQTVSREYARRTWVRRRCEHAREWLLTSFAWLDAAAPIHDQAFAWLYATSMPAHILLVADLQNPTIRKSLVASHDVLARHGWLSLHERLLAILGSAAMDRGQVEQLLAACADTFDVAARVVTTPFFGSTTIADAARPIAIEGGHELIAGGFHREAMLWIGIIHTWCQKALQNDASDEAMSRVTLHYPRLLTQLGVRGYEDLEDRMGQIRELLPDVWAVAEEIMATNPAIRE